MSDRFARTVKLIGEENMSILKSKTIAIFGLGGVGSYVFEGLLRAGIGNFILIDKDKIDETNINRQLLAYNSTIGLSKVLVAKKRALDINPSANILCHELFYLEETKKDVDLSEVDYIIDAVDTVTAKLIIIEQAKKLNIPVISSLGTGNKIDNTKFKITDIYKTKICPLARVMRRELKNRNIKDVKVIYSEEEPLVKQKEVASISFVPSVAGLMIAGEVVNEIIKMKPNK